jgi:hydroxymethylglutaryl-CoA lyase
MADPRQVANLVQEVSTRWPDVELGIHLHDTNGMSLANVIVAMQHGVRQFDTSLCGLGGGVILPDELESVGNTPTEDLVNMLREMDIDTGVDFGELESVAVDVSERLGLEPISHVQRGGTREYILETTGSQ